MKRSNHLSLIPLTTIFIVVIAAVFSGCDTNQPPEQPLITASDTVVESQSKVVLTASTTDPDGDRIEWLWQADTGSFDQVTTSSTIWTAPAVTDTQVYILSVQARDEKGAESSSDISITVQPDPGGEEIQVILGSNDSIYYAPFWGDGNDYSRCQFLYKGYQIGQCGRIKRIEWMSPVNGWGSYYQNFAVSLTQTTAQELEAGFHDNYQGASPQIVFTDPSIVYPETADQWFAIDCFSSFDYDTTRNLIVEFSWKNDNGYSAPSYGFATSDPQSNTTPYEDATEGLVENRALYLRLTIVQ